MKTRTNLMSSAAHAPEVGGTTGENVVARTNVKQSAAAIKAKAQAFAAKLSDDDNASEYVERYLNAKIDVAMGPQWMYLLFKDTYTDEELAETPIPGTKMETKDEITGVVTKHNNPDEYDAPKADGSIGTVSRYWHWDVADALPAGKLIEADFNRAKALAESDEWGAKRIADNANKRLNNLRGLVARGLATWHQIHALEAYPNVKFTWDKERKPVYVMDDETGEPKVDKNGNAIVAVEESGKNKGKPKTQMVYCRTESPVILSNAEEIEGEIIAKNKALSIVQFLSLDVSRAMEKGGTYDDLLATMRREQNDNEEADVPMLEKVADFGDYALAISNYLDNDSNYTLVKRALDKKSEGNDKLLQSIDELQKLLAALVNGATNARERIENIRKVA